MCIAFPTTPCQLGMFQWDPREGDVITDDSSFGRKYGDGAYQGASDNMQCQGGTHLWNQVVEDESICGGAIECASCTIDKITSKCNISPRSATVEMRRKFYVYADGQKQYVEKAAIAIGLNCVSVGAYATAAGWTFDNIEVLV